MDIQSLTELSDSELLARVRGMARNERRATVALIAHLAEIENRRLYLGEACGSLFTYCIKVLHLSEPAAYNRIQAARAARRFPAVLVSLEQGLVHLTAVRLLAPVLTMENHRDLLSAAAHKTKREVEELLARLRPQPDVPGGVRKLPAAQKSVPQPQPLRPGRDLFGSREEAKLEQTGREQSNHGEAGAAQPVSAASSDAQTAAKPTAQPAAQRAIVVPLAPERYRVQFTAGAATREKLRRAQELLRHAIPDGDVAQVIDLALDLLVRDLEKRRFAASAQPRRGERKLDAHGKGVPQPDTISASQPMPSPSPSPSLLRSPTSAQSSPSPAASRYIAAEIRRAVWQRDQGRCAFVSATGERCTERSRLEFDHIRPHADGGSAEVTNVRLLCRQHNQYEARQFFGLWQADDAIHPSSRCT